MLIIKSNKNKTWFKSYFEELKMKVYIEIFKDAPVDTGYLRSMIKLIEVSENEFMIYNDVYYMEYTEEEWHGKRAHLKNPNQDWFKKAVNRAYTKIIEEVSRTWS